MAQSYSIVLIQCEEEEEYEENWAILRNTYLKNYLADLLQIWYAKSCSYMEDIKYVNLIEIGPVVSYRDTRC